MKSKPVLSPQERFKQFQLFTHSTTVSGIEIAGTARQYAPCSRQRHRASSGDRDGWSCHPSRRKQRVSRPIIDIPSKQWRSVRRRDRLRPSWRRLQVGYLQQPSRLHQCLLNPGFMPSRLLFRQDMLAKVFCQCCCQKWQSDRRCPYTICTDSDYLSGRWKQSGEDGRWTVLYRSMRS